MIKINASLKSSITSCTGSMGSGRQL